MPPHLALWKPNQMPPCSSTITAPTLSICSYMLIMLSLQLPHQLHHCKQFLWFGDGPLLSLGQCMSDILDRASLAECKLCTTPINTKPMLCTNDPQVQDALTFTRPDIAYAVQQVWLCRDDPWEPHLAALKCILHYICGPFHFGLVMRPFSYDDLIVYFDAN